jgi:hypothetical protein
MLYSTLLFLPFCMDFGIAETGIARGSPLGTTTEVLRFGFPFAEIRVVSAGLPVLATGHCAAPPHRNRPRAQDAAQLGFRPRRRFRQPAATTARRRPFKGAQETISSAKASTRHPSSCYGEDFTGFTPSIVLF